MVFWVFSWVYFTTSYPLEPENEILFTFISKLNEPLVFFDGQLPNSYPTEMVSFRAKRLYVGLLMELAGGTKHLF